MYLVYKTIPSKQKAIVTSWLSPLLRSNCCEAPVLPWPLQGTHHAWTSHPPNGQRQKCHHCVGERTSMKPHRNDNFCCCCGGGGNWRCWCCWCCYSSCHCMLFLLLFQDKIYKSKGEIQQNGYTFETDWGKQRHVLFLRDFSASQTESLKKVEKFHETLTFFPVDHTTNYKQITFKSYAMQKLLRYIHWSSIRSTNVLYVEWPFRASLFMAECQVPGYQKGEGENPGWVSLSTLRAQLWKSDFASKAKYHSFAKWIKETCTSMLVICPHIIAEHTSSRHIGKNLSV